MSPDRSFAEKIEHSKKKKETENDEDEYEDEDTDYYVQKLNNRKCSIHLTKQKRKRSRSNEEVPYTNNEPNEEVLYTNDYNNSGIKNDEWSENFNPAQMLEERIERSRKSNGGSGGRRGTIAFADELQDTLADLCKQMPSCPNINVDGTEENRQCEQTMDSSSDIKSILKQHSNENICEEIEGEYTRRFKMYIIQGR